MAETPKLSVKKALQKIRSADAPKSKNERRDEEIDALDEEIQTHESAKVTAGRAPAAFDQAEVNGRVA